MFQEWKDLWNDKVYLFIWIGLLLTVLCVLKGVSEFLVFNEGRDQDILLNDFVLNMIAPANVAKILFSITWVCILSSLLVGLRTPKRAMLVFLSIILIGVIRCIILYMVPLLPPEGIIPLRDELLEGTFYCNKVLEKDLFFSGHTSNMTLLIFLVDFKWMKYVLTVATIVVGYLVLKQHVHYTIDVLAAPFFAYLAYKLAEKTRDSILKKIDKRTSIV